MDKNKIIVFDTTLRDGEQSPGASMNTEEKIQIALQLERLGVDIMEAGFAAASPGDFDAINQIAKQIHSIGIASLARALEKDIKAAGEAISPAKNRRIHTFIATSPIHMEHKLKMTPDEVIKRAVEAVKYAKTFVDDVEFSCEDAGRSDIVFLKEICTAVVEAGARTLNLPDTVGFRMPDEIYNMVKSMVDFIGDRAIISVHNHNDLGLAVANTLASIKAGARQVECTINGLGERAGNAALEEIVMTIKTRNDEFAPLYTDIVTKEIYATSRLVASITGIEPQPNKAIVGKNAFAHESGIHQDGMLKCAQTYEIIKAEDIGAEKNSLVLGKHSGRHAFKDKLINLGFDLDDNEINEAFIKFKELCDKKKEIFDDDIRALVSHEIIKIPEIYSIQTLSTSSCNAGHSSAAVSIKFNDNIISDAALGNGTADAIFKVIDRISGISGELKDYKVNAVSQGKDALAKIAVKVVFEGSSCATIGHGLDIDTMMASAKAYVSALNSYLSMKNRQ
ncbi:2-isopropylmalate synthase [Campylobacter fetus]|uniref:2-isopropylmalate synthase n=1 Tax=Campylobacter fetus subsp. testudinum TaxID=1507806 RepID=A0AAX0HDJ6_CAMFE|nr:2-isopropylmalate synthase [Campylobacter fetus]AJB45884.1 2-isopropylmalate synthase [Campylobacter fetus subsp. testudinum]ALV65326.1 2-isopropylmalate synthase, bacterial type [Campylobacter fetus subsp. testudinum Sp3]AVK82056.1 2-isopropylmalate synthase [Campylobacter fetus subsp. testudinum]EAK0826956.1 2-isopropylmalate synthase [Campylobacter fetus]EAK0829477.1 2-isopropylmalate synthase [Campylobacter fetus]